MNLKVPAHAGKPSTHEMDEASNHLIRILLKGCGLTPAI